VVDAAAAGVVAVDHRAWADHRVIVDDQADGETSGRSAKRS
jgi:hypothetical protein